MNIQRASIIAVLIIAATITLGFGGRMLILGGTNETVVAAQTIEDQIKQAIASDTAMRGRSTVNENDVIIKEVAEREDGNWIVATATREGENQQATSVVMQRSEDDRYDMVVSPGTDIDQATLKRIGVPGSVIQLLAERGQVTDLTEGQSN